MSFRCWNYDNISLIAFHLFGKQGEGHIEVQRRVQYSLWGSAERGSEESNQMSYIWRTFLLSYSFLAVLKHQKRFIWTSSSILGSSRWWPHIPSGLSECFIFIPVQDTLSYHMSRFCAYTCYEVLPCLKDVMKFENVKAFVSVSRLSHAY